MKGWILSGTDASPFPELALVIFVATFVIAALWVVRPGSKALYRERGLLPLESDGNVVSSESRDVQST